MKSSLKRKTKSAVKSPLAKPSVLPPLPPLPQRLKTDSAQSPLLQPEQFADLGGGPLPPNGVNLQAMLPFSRSLAAKIRSDPLVGPALASVKKSLTRELRLNPNAVNKPEILAEISKQLLQDPSFLQAMQGARDLLGPNLR